MMIYIDTAAPEDVRNWRTFGVVRGVTTTPTILARHQGVDVQSRLEEIAQLVDEVHVEALGDTSEEITAQAMKMAEYGSAQKLVFKIPISRHGIIAAAELIERGFRVNIHLVYTLAQAYFAASHGATYICVLVGRLIENGHNASTLISECRDLLRARGYRSKLMAGSIRERRHLEIALSSGADCAAVPPSVLEASFAHYLTDAGIEQFKRDLKRLS
jgi:transaldolase